MLTMEKIITRSKLRNLIKSYSKVRVSNISYMQEPLKYVSYPKKPLPTKKETVDMMWKFLQYCKLLDKTSCDISTDTWNFSR